MKNQEKSIKELEESMKETILKQEEIREKSKKEQEEIKVDLMLKEKESRETELKLMELKTKRINETIGLINLSLDLIDYKRNEDGDQEEKTKELIKMLSQNHSMIGSILSELGVVFDSKKQIFDLNERIRKMEEELSREKLNYTQVSVYVENIRKLVRMSLEEQGVHSSVEVGFNPNLFVSISLFGQDARKPNSSYYRNEEDYIKDCELKELRYKKCLENFKTVVSSFNDTNIVFEESNLEKIKSIINKTVGEISYNVDVEVKNRFLKENNEFVESVPILDSVKLYFTTLPSAKSLEDAFKRFREGVY